MITFVVVAALALIAVVSPVDRVDPDTAVAWHHDIDKAIADAEQSGKPVLMYFTRLDCGPCQNMKKWVFTRRKIAELIATKYVPLKVDLTDPDRRQIQTSGSLNIQAVPTMIVFAPSGREITRQVGGLSASQFTSMLENALTQLPGTTPNTSAQAEPRKEPTP